MNHARRRAVARGVLTREVQERERGDMNDGRRSEPEQRSPVAHSAMTATAEQSSSAPPVRAARRKRNRDQYEFGEMSLNVGRVARTSEEPYGEQNIPRA